MNSKYVLVFLYYFNAVANSAKILAIFSTPNSLSGNLNHAVIAQLAKQNHRITLITPDVGLFEFPEKEMIHEIDVHEATEQVLSGSAKIRDLDDELTVLSKTHDLLLQIAEAQLTTQPVKDLLYNTHAQFDIVITEVETPVMFSFANKYKIPLVAVSSGFGTKDVFEATNNPNYPNMFATDLEGLSFWGKIWELRRQWSYASYFDWYLSHSNNLSRKIFGPRSKPIEKTKRKIDVLLLNAIPELTGNRPVSPNIIYVDDFDLKFNAYLPENVKTFLDNSTRGVVFFSMDQTVPESRLSRSSVELLMETLGELRYKVIWHQQQKLEVHVPPYVQVYENLPVDRVLEHPHVKVFITQGGLQSILSAVKHAVPIVGLPFASHRPAVYKHIEKIGAGLSVELWALTKKNLKRIIKDVLQKDSYHVQMALLRSRALAQPVPGVDRAVWWIEYAIHNRGAKGLRPPHRPPSYWRNMVLNLYIFILLLLVLTLAVAIFLILKSKGIKDSVFSEKWKLV